MVSEYHFHADQPDPDTTRWLHLSFYLGALLLTVAGVYELYRYATHWTAGDDNSHLWQLVLGIVYLLVAVLVAYATYNHGGSGEIPPERFVDIVDGTMTYQLDQTGGRQVLDLDDITGVTRASVRDLVLDLRGGKRLVLPIYLVDDEGKQRELEAILAAAAAAGPIA